MAKAPKNMKQAEADWEKDPRDIAADKKGAEKLLAKAKKEKKAKAKGKKK